MEDGHKKIRAEGPDFERNVFQLLEWNVVVEIAVA
jgi:hypothetical protein